jgi:hypothetical protein
VYGRFILKIFRYPYYRGPLSRLRIICFYLYKRFPPMHGMDDNFFSISIYILFAQSGKFYTHANFGWSYAVSLSLLYFFSISHFINHYRVGSDQPIFAFRLIDNASYDRIILFPIYRGRAKSALHSTSTMKGSTSYRLTVRPLPVPKYVISKMR